MANLKKTMRAGHANEADLVSIIKTLTPHVWTNVRLRTLHTEKGNTEIDIIFYFRGCVHLVETKRILEINGEYQQYKWKLRARSGEFRTLNILTQSRLHAKVFCDRYFDKYRSYPILRSRAVVPDGVLMSDSIKGEVLTFSEYYRWLCSLPEIGDMSYKYRCITFLEGITK